MSRKLVLFSFVIGLFFLLGSSVGADDAHVSYCSTTGPVPPRGVLPPKTDFDRRAIVDETEISITPYYWRHGCGPTAVGMVVGYWDGKGFPQLIPGDASTQTDDVDQAIASGGEMLDPNAAGSEEHCEDYCLPRDSGGAILDDAYITAGRAAHADNCIADWMFTSQSTRIKGSPAHGLPYGWSWSGDISPAFNDYVNSRSIDYTPSSQYLDWRATGAAAWNDNWNTLKAEIDAERPMVFLVDSDGDGGTDHFVTIVGYRINNGNREYGCKDTWTASGGVTRWERFREMSGSYSWGICTANTFSLEKSAGADGEWWVDKAYGGIETGTLAQPFNTLGEAVAAASAGDRIFIKGGLWDDNIEISKYVFLDSY